MSREHVDAARAPLPDDRPLLVRRAAQLARTAAPERPSTRFPAVVFALAGERYAVDARVVRQVTILRDMTPLPGARAPIFGVTHWRGDVLTILDLREVLGARIRGLPDLSRLVVIEGPDRTFGVLADIQVEMADLDRTSIRPLPADEESGSRFIRGIADDAVILLDEVALLNAFGTKTPDLADKATGG